MVTKSVQLRYKKIKYDFIGGNRKTNIWSIFNLLQEQL